MEVATTISNMSLLLLDEIMLAPLSIGNYFKTNSRKRAEEKEKEMKAAVKKEEERDKILKERAAAKVVKPVEPKKEEAKEEEPQVLKDFDKENTPVVITSGVNGETIFRNEYDPSIYAISTDELFNLIDNAVMEVRSTRVNLIGVITGVLFFTCEDIVSSEVLNQFAIGDRNIATPVMEVANTVSKYFNGLIMSTNYSAYEINEVIDPVELYNIILYLKKWLESRNHQSDPLIDEVEDEARDLKETAIKAGTVKDVDIIRPFHINNSRLDINNDMSKITLAQIKTLEDQFKGMLDNLNYQFNKVGDLFELVIFDNYYGPRSFTIDPDLIMGNGYNIMLSTPTSYTPVNVTHKNIISRALNTPGYILMENEYKETLKDIFANTNIYNFIDMSMGREVFKGISKSDYQKLNDILTQIIGDPDLGGIRLRFREWKSVKAFILVSDNKCKTPLPDLNTIIKPGLKIVVTDKAITKYDNENIVYSHLITTTNK